MEVHLTISILKDNSQHVSQQQLVVVNNPQRLHLRVHVTTLFHTGGGKEQSTVKWHSDENRSEIWAVFSWLLPYLMPDSKMLGFRGECRSDRVSEKPLCRKQVIMASLVNIASLVLLRAFFMVPSLISSFTAFSLFRASSWCGGKRHLKTSWQTGWTQRADGWGVSTVQIPLKANSPCSRRICGIWLVNLTI